jgi:hypothetical protein
MKFIQIIIAIAVSVIGARAEPSGNGCDDQGHCWPRGAKMVKARNMDV